MSAFLLPYIKSCVWKGKMIYVNRCISINEKLICKFLFLHWHFLKGSNACNISPMPRSSESGGKISMELGFLIWYSQSLLLRHWGGRGQMKLWYSGFQCYLSSYVSSVQKTLYIVPGHWWAGLWLGLMQMNSGVLWRLYSSEYRIKIVGPETGIICQSIIELSVLPFCHVRKQENMYKDRAFQFL